MAMQARLFPPAWVQLKSGESVAYIDPAYLRIYSRKFPKKQEWGKWPEPVDGLPDPTLEKADLILITHAHREHCKWLTIARLLKKGTVIAAPQSCAGEIAAPFRTVRAGDEFTVGPFQVRAVEAYNLEGKAGKVEHSKGRGVGYLVTAEKKTLYHAGDTDFVPEMKSLGHVASALLPACGGREMDATAAVEAATAIRARCTIPMHCSAKLATDFKKQMAAKNPKMRVMVPAVGKSFKVR